MKRRKLLFTTSLLLSAALAAQVSAAAPPDANTHSGACYEVFVYSFYDSDGDGIGDLPGLTQKLDYINDGDPSGGEDLGCDMIWTMPVFPSPTYHKYDVTSYRSIDPQYGTMEDFEVFLASCHERGIRVILDLPLNHTSVEHPWFRDAAEYLKSLPEGQEPSADDCPYLEYYNFSPEPAYGYAALPDSAWYYEARFWEGMPDLNLDSPAVRRQIAEITDYWLDKGVDGFRLDAVTSFYTDDTGANIGFLSWLSETVSAEHPDAYMVGEAWAGWDTYSRYYESGIDSLFNFEFSGAEGLIASVVSGKREAQQYGKRIEEQQEYLSSLGTGAVDAPFYTNHDMARSAGYYAYDDGSRTKLAEALNLLMPGNAFLYYGEELGMKGAGQKDENKRAPMYWSAGSGEEGMCQGPPDMDSFDMKFGPLSEQSQDPSSIYQYVRNVLRIRTAHPAVSGGSVRVIPSLSGKNTCAMIRESEEEQLVEIFSTSEEPVSLDLGEAGLGDASLETSLTVSEEEVLLRDGILTLPPFGIALLAQGS